MKRTATEPCDVALQRGRGPSGTQSGLALSRDPKEERWCMENEGSSSILKVDSGISFYFYSLFPLEVNALCSLVIQRKILLPSATLDSVCYLAF